MSEKDLKRIKNLLDLSKSDNPHEAELAAERAAQLMAKLQISEAELGSFDSENVNIDEFTIDEAGQLTHWQARSAHAAAAAFGGQVYSAGDITRMDGSEYTQMDFMKKTPHKKRTRIMFVGREQDRTSVIYLYQYFCSEIKRLADQGWKERESHPNAFLNPPTSVRSWKDSFRKGCAAHISERIQDMRAKTKEENQCEALVKVETYEKDAEEFLEKKGCKMVKSRATEAAAYGAGWEAGQNVNTEGGGLALGAAKEQLK